MPKINDLPRLFLTLLLSVISTWAQADEDWLIARVNGQWTWESAGPEGRVRKNFLNQEVLRRNEDGPIVVVSALPIVEGDTVTCSETARRNPQDACSSAFLSCQPGGGMLSSFFGLFVRGVKGATETRSSYRCSIDADAVLEAAHRVGLIERIEPKTSPKKSPDAETKTNLPNGD